MGRWAWIAKTPVLVAMVLLLVVACQPQTVIVKEKKVTEVEPLPSILFVVPDLGDFGQSTLEDLLRDFEVDTGVVVDLRVLQ